MNKIKFSAAALAVVFAFCSAFTTQNATSGDNLYRVTGSDADHYFVTDITGQSQGINYRCIESSDICTVTADPNDVSGGEVLKTDASIQEEGTFQPL